MEIIQNEPKKDKETILSTESTNNSSGKKETNDNSWRSMPTEVLLNNQFEENSRHRRKKYSARRLIGSRIIESAAYCNQKLLAHLYLNSTQNTSVNWIIRLLLSLVCRPKVILLSGGHCISKYSLLFQEYVQYFF